jgi:gliding motility-associated protein GldE
LSFVAAGVIFEIIILAILLVLSGLISASESAIILLTDDESVKLRYGGSRKSEIISRLLEKRALLTVCLAVTRNILNVIIVCMAAVIAVSIFSGNIAGITLSMTFILLILLSCDILSRIYIVPRHVQFIGAMYHPLYFLLGLFQPLASHITGSKKLFTGNESDNLKSSSKIIEEETIIKGIANFGNTNVSAIMCPRIDVTAVDIKWGFDRIIPVIINSGFSRIPVYSGSFDTVRGILYAKDVLPYSNYPASFKWQSLLRPPYFVPETKKINELLNDFQLRKIHMAVVIDEYGGTSGIVTLEDILEEIVGEITDENDEEITLFRRIDETHYIFEGKILLHDFCKILGIEEDIYDPVRGESETLAGLMLELAGEIPQKDQVINFHNFMFRIESVDRRRIKEILVEITKKDEKPEEI